MRVLRWGQSEYETEADLERERAIAGSLGMEWRAWPRAKVVPEGTADVLVVTSGARVDEAALRPVRPSVVLTTTSGHDHIDLAACLARGVRVGRCPEARRDAVVEHALAALLDGMHDYSAMSDWARSGDWGRDRLPALAPRGLHGSRVLVVGLGVIGRRMAEVLTALGAEVLGVDPGGVAGPARAVDLDEALPSVDAVTLHCALTPSSRGVLSSRRLDELPSHAVVVNTARGECLDVEAAVEAVRDGRLRGLSCDVFPVEPYRRLARGANVRGVRFTPHAAGFTHDLGARVARDVGAALTAIAAGDALPYEVRGS